MFLPDRQAAPRRPRPTPFALLTRWAFIGSKAESRHGHVRRRKTDA